MKHCPLLDMEIKRCVDCNLCEKQKEAFANYKGIAPDLEGGNSIYYYVCGECHLLLHDNWKFCPECGRKVLWNG